MENRFCANSYFVRRVDLSSRDHLYTCTCICKVRGGSGKGAGAKLLEVGDGFEIRKKTIFKP